MATLNVYGTAEDGEVLPFYVAKTGQTAQLGVESSQQQDTTDEMHIILFFNAAAALAAAGIAWGDITDVKLHFYITALGAGSGDMASIAAYVCDQGDMILQAADYGVAMDVGEFAGELVQPGGGWTTGAKEIPFDLGGISQGFDRIELDPTWGYGVTTSAYTTLGMSENSDSTKRPWLEFTYTVNGQTYTKIITENPKLNLNILKKSTRTFNQTTLLTSSITKRGIKQPLESVNIGGIITRFTNRNIENTNIITGFVHKIASRTLNNVVVLSDIPPLLIFGRVLHETAKVTDSSIRFISHRLYDIQSVKEAIIHGVSRLLSDVTKITESLVLKRLAIKVITEVAKITGSIMRTVVHVLRETVLIIMRIVTRFNGQVTALWRRENKDTDDGDWKKQPKDL